MGDDESAVIGFLGGGYGEPPVRVADLEEAARRRAAARAAARPAGTVAPVDVPDTAPSSRTPAAPPPVLADVPPGQDGTAAPPESPQHT
ncbi:hypothetical protein [Catellatospora sp. NPDC049609]|uniref:hypothetical protein n=1 Tax=Catellatospora sp. NPDC049609 TaxID=3155505 RepID=UPI0034247757